MVVLFAVSCQPNIQKEEEAVLSVLKAESDALLAGDFERFEELHLKSPVETRIEMGIYGYSVYKGWDRVSGLVRDFLEGERMENVENKKENCIVHVSGKSAWVTCDNVWFNSSSNEIYYNNLQIAFLEKLNGAWKISFSAYYTKGDQNEMTIH
jgi:hypothetical protein